MRLLLPAALAILAAACGASPPEGAIRVSGHVEATEVRIAPEVGGRILELHASEGDRVARGDLVLRLDARDTELALDRARAERDAAEAQLALIRAGARPEEIRQAEAQVASAEADVAAARAERQGAQQDLERFERLLARDAGSVKQRDDAATRAEVAGERVEAAEGRVRAARAALARLESGPRREEVQASRARAAAAAAQVAALEEAIADSTLTAPVGGIVTERLAQVGEVVAPRLPVLVLVDLDRVWADVFVPEPAVPRIRIGQAATLFTDAGGSGIQGRVTYVSPRAEFTPRNVQTADERARLVYRVRIHADNPEGILKQGMPVEAELPLAPANAGARVRGEAWAHLLPRRSER